MPPLTPHMYYICPYTYTTRMLHGMASHMDTIHPPCPHACPVPPMCWPIPPSVEEVGIWHGGGHSGGHGVARRVSGQVSMGRYMGKEVGEEG